MNAVEPIGGSTASPAELKRAGIVGYWGVLPSMNSSTSS